MGIDYKARGTTQRKGPSLVGGIMYVPQITPKQTQFLISIYISISAAQVRNTL